MSSVLIPQYALVDRRSMYCPRNRPSSVVFYSLHRLNSKRFASQKGVTSVPSFYSGSFEKFAKWVSGENNT